MELVAYRLPDTAAIRDDLHAFDDTDPGVHMRTQIPPTARHHPLGAHVWARRQRLCALDSAPWRQALARRRCSGAASARRQPRFERAVGASSRNEGVSRNGRSLASRSALCGDDRVALRACTAAAWRVVSPGDPYGSELALSRDGLVSAKTVDSSGTDRRRHRDPSRDRTAGIARVTPVLLRHRPRGSATKSTRRWPAQGPTMLPCVRRSSKTMTSPGLVASVTALGGPRRRHGGAYGGRRGTHLRSHRGARDMRRS